MQKQEDLGRSTCSSAKTNECYICSNDKDTKLLRDLVDVFSANKYNARMFSFMTKGLKEEKDNGTTKFIDTTRNRNVIIGTLFNSQSKIEINATRFLKSLGFSIDEKGYWSKPKNEARLKAFMIHMNMYGYRAKDLMD